MSQLDLLVNRFLDDRSELAPDELDELIAGLRAEPARAAELREQLIVDDLVAQKLTVDRRNFLAQVEQRIADFERSENEIDNQVAELHELAASHYERPSSWSGNSTWVRAALALSLAAIVAGFFVVPRILPGDRRPLAKVVAVQGGVTATDQAAALAASTTLFSGQLIDAPAESSLTMEYDDKTQVRIGGGSRVTLGIEAGSGAKRIHIERGDVWADVARQTAGAMQFVTPHAVATVLGTELRLTVTGDETLLEVTEGEVQLDGVAEQESIDVAADQSGLATDDSLDLRSVAWPDSTEGLAYAFDPFVRRIPRARNPATGNWYASPLASTGSAVANEFTDARELSGGYFHSLEDGQDIVAVSQPGGEFTLEIVYFAAAGTSVAADPTAANPPAARIVGLEGEDGQTNFQLSQEGDELVFHLRTDVGEAAEPLRFQLAHQSAPGRPTHLTITYRDGQLAAYQDGKLLKTGDSLRGSLAAWTPGPFVLGADSRGRFPWRGTLEALAIYHRCLETSEVEQNVRNFQVLMRSRP